MRLLLAAGANPSVADKHDGTTPLHLAARVGNAEAINALVEAGADVSVREKCSGYTPLHYAAVYVQATTALLKAGADAEALDIGRETPVQRARRAQAANKRKDRDYAAIFALLEESARTSENNETMQTPTETIKRGVKVPYAVKNVLFSWW